MVSAFPPYTSRRKYFYILDTLKGQKVHEGINFFVANTNFIDNTALVLPTSAHKDFPFPEAESHGFRPEQCVPH